MKKIYDINSSYHLIYLRDHFTSVIRGSEVIAVPQLSEERDVCLDENTRMRYFHVIELDFSSGLRGSSVFDNRNHRRMHT